MASRIGPTSTSVQPSSSNNVSQGHGNNNNNNTNSNININTNTKNNTDTYPKHALDNGTDPLQISPFTRHAGFISSTPSRALAEYANYSPPPISPNTAVPPMMSRDVSPLSSFSGPSTGPSAATATARPHNASVSSNCTITAESHRQDSLQPNSLQQSSHRQDSIPRDSRRPSYASQVSQASQNSRASKISEDIAPFERHSTSSVSTYAQKPTSPMVFPDPSHVFDSSLMPPPPPPSSQQQQQTTSQQQSSLSNYIEKKRSPSSVSSAASSISNTSASTKHSSNTHTSSNKPKKASFFSKLMYKRDFTKEEKKKDLSHKSSESSLLSGTTSILHRPSNAFFNSSRQPFHHHNHPSFSNSSGSGNNNSNNSSREDKDRATEKGAQVNEKEGLLQKIKSRTDLKSITTHSGQSQDPAQKESSIQPYSSFASANDLSSIYQLDTDLEHMTGIVSSPNPTDDISTSLAVTSSFNSNSNSTSALPKLAPAISEGKWQAPESWDTVPVTSSSLMQTPSEQTIKHIDLPAAKSNVRYCARIFRDDNTFSTLSSPLGVSVTEFSEQIARKFFLESPAGYQLTIRVGGLTRVLSANEQPLVYQNHLLELMGYTSKDRLPDLGRDDLSYLAKFKFSKMATNAISEHEKAILSRDFAHINISHMDILTIPILLYPHASKVESLNVSENPSFTIPSDFIQSCINLVEIKSVRNQLVTFPANIALAPSLQSLDLRQNLINSISENVQLDRFTHLSFLDLQGNFLKKLPSSFSLLQELKYLNISSNYFDSFPVEVTLLKNLVDLDISFNRIKTLPDEIGNLKCLEKLAISNSYLMHLPDSFVQLSKLEELDLRYNQLQNINLLGSLPKLSVLYASKNSVNSLESNFSQLKLFYFDRNPITNVEFKSPHSTLTTLNLFKAQISSILDSLLDTIPLIEKLVLDRNHITTLPAKIGTLKSLRHLSIVANQLDSVPAEIGQLTNLERLDLHDNNIIRLPEQIWNLSSLVYLNVASNLLENFPKNIVHLSTSHNSISSSSSSALEVAAVSGLSNELAVPGSSPSSMPTQFSQQDNGRRPSTLSISSAYDEYRPKAVTISNNTAKSQSPKNVSPSEPNLKKLNTVVRTSLAQSLLTLILCDNQLNEESFAEISLLTELQVLNISYNDFGEIPLGALRRLTNLTSLYMSGNNLSSIPGDDLEALTGLTLFVANSNKIHNLPAELGKVPHLTVLDVGSNTLKYNIHNWPYDWNWRFNRELRYLNFSGNRRLEVNAPNVPNSAYRREVDMSDFSILSNIRILGLMDVTLTSFSAPDQSANCRVRTYGSEVHSYPFGLADALGNNNNLSITDMVLERFRGNDTEIIIGLFDGRNTNVHSGNKVSKLIQETFGGIFSDELKKLKDPDETVSDAMRRAFLNTDKEIGNTILMPAEDVMHTPIGHRSSTAANLDIADGMTGSCATIIYVQENKLFVGNTGDSMAIMATTGGEYNVLTTRHDPTTQTELARIRASGGIISSTGKLDDILDVSRAIGFYNLMPHIHASPSILEWDLTDSDEMIILASKQLWEYVSYQIAVDIARTEKGDLMRAAAKLRDFAIAYGASDKIMVMVLGVGLSRKRNRGFYGGTANNINATTNGYNTGGVPGVLPIYGKDGTLSMSDGMLDQHMNPANIHNSPSVVSALDEYPSFKRRRDKGKDSELARLGGEVAPPQGELAIVFTDIKNSTSLWETYPSAMGSAIKQHNVVMRRQIRLNGGYEVKTEGDAFVVSFPTPTSALLWCLSAQQALMYADWPAKILETEDGCEVYDDGGQLLYRGLSVRMGIHWGSPFCETDPITRRMDYFGPMVNKAARVSAVADGGQISLSSDFIAEMRKIEKEIEVIKETGDRTRLLESVGGNEAMERSIEQDMKSLSVLGWEVKDLGEFKLKGLENPEIISLAYPKPLLGRFEHHLLSKKKKTEVVSTTYGALNVENLPRLRLCAIRMENICSQIGEGRGFTLPSERESSKSSATDPGSDDNSDPNAPPNGSQSSGGKPSPDQKKKMKEMDQMKIPSPSALQQQQLAIPLPNTEFEYGMFLNNMVTRIENALTTLALRAAMYNFGQASGGLLKQMPSSGDGQVDGMGNATANTNTTVDGVGSDDKSLAAVQRPIGAGDINQLLEAAMKALELAAQQAQMYKAEQAHNQAQIQQLQQLQQQQPQGQVQAPIYQTEKIEKILAPTTTLDKAAMIAEKAVNMRKLAKQSHTSSHSLGTAAQSQSYNHGQVQSQAHPERDATGEPSNFFFISSESSLASSANSDSKQSSKQGSISKSCSEVFGYDSLISGQETSIAPVSTRVSSVADNNNNNGGGYLEMQGSPAAVLPLTDHVEKPQNTVQRQPVTVNTSDSTSSSIVHGFNNQVYFFDNTGDDGSHSNTGTHVNTGNQGSHTRTNEFSYPPSGSSPTTTSPTTQQPQNITPSLSESSFVTAVQSDHGEDLWNSNTHGSGSSRFAEMNIIDDLLGEDQNL